MMRITNEDIYADYTSWLRDPGQDTASEKPLSRSVFLQISGFLTCKQQNITCTIDYVLVTLVHENFRTLREINHAEVSEAEREKLRS